MLKQTALALALGLAVVGAAFAAEICEDVNDVANGWNEVANVIAEHQDDEWTDADIDGLIDLVGTLHDSSSALASALGESDNPSHPALGARLQSELDDVAALTTADDAGLIVDEVDDVTAEMDIVTDDCDAHH